MAPDASFDIIYRMAFSDFIRFLRTQKHGFAAAPDLMIYLHCGPGVNKKLRFIIPCARKILYFLPSIPTARRIMGLTFTRKGRILARV